jgi:heat shock protein HslJ
MKIFIPVIASIALLTTSCSHSQKATKTAATAAIKSQTTLTGTWELEFIPANGGTMDQLYPNRKPTITFNEADNSFSTYTGCNTAHGKLVKDGGKINFPDDMTMTRMLCQGDGEKIYLGYLKRINTYSISADGTRLTFIQGDMALMNFHRLAPK